MTSVTRHFHIVLRPAVAVLSLGLTAAVAQTQTRPGEVPYLNLPPSAVPASPPALPELRPSTETPGGASTLDALKERDEQLAKIRAEQQRASETEAKLKHEIEAIGDDRRKLNTQLIEV